ncbi:MAG: hypothetical protein Q9227_008992 [Pyrenula ochraceoflavens]
MNQMSQADYDEHTGYAKNIDSIREEEYPTLKDTTYLDHAGTTLYAKSLIEDFSKEMMSKLYGNPHSASTSSLASTQRIDDTRLRVLQFFNADPDYFDVVFVANATAAIKLVVEAFRDIEEGFWYGYHADAHTSLVGIREVATNGVQFFEQDEEVELWLSDQEQCPTLHSSGTRLFAYPGQSNMTGHRPSFSWLKRLRNLSRIPGVAPLYTLFDAASLVSTSPLDLSDPDASPDFTALSFYKIFGFPDLGALIVRKTSGDVLRRRRYFGGGTVDMVISIGERWHTKKQSSVHSHLEDGTVAFHSIIALGCSLTVHQKLFGSMKAISRHTAYLSKSLFSRLSSLKHDNGIDVCEFYGDQWTGPTRTEIRSGILTLNVRNAKGEFIPASEVDKLASIKNIQLRSGGLCNPGGIARHLRLSPAEMRRNFAAGQRCGKNDLILAGKPISALRVSVGAMSSLQDINNFASFLEEFFVNRCPVLDTTPSPVSPPPASSPPQFIVESLSIYPIKSCGAFNIPSDIDWEIKPEGLAWDRQWCVVHQGTGAALSQKQYPRMALLRPGIDLQKRVLQVACPEADWSESKLEIPLDEEEPASSAGNWLPCANKSKVCNQEMKVQVYQSSEVAAFFSEILQVPCTLARLPSETSQHHLEPDPLSQLSQNMAMLRASLPGQFPASPPPSPSTSNNRTIFSNESPILLISKSSVASLNDSIEQATIDPSKAHRGTIPASTFRGNILITEDPSSTSSTTPSSTSAYVEESWERISITCPTSDAMTSTRQPVEFTVMGPCQRCQMVCINQSDGTKSQEPYSTLAKTRRRNGRVSFGIHLRPETLGRENIVIKAGDVLTVVQLQTAS